MDISTDPGCICNMDPDIVLGYILVRDCHHGHGCQCRSLRSAWTQQQTPSRLRSTFQASALSLINAQTLASEEP